MSDASVVVEDIEGVRWVRIGRPEVLGALNSEMTVLVAEAVESAQSEESVRVVVLTGTGGSFSAGADMETLRVAPQFPDETMIGANRMVRAVVNLDKPVIAAVNGIAAGVACSAALASDLIVASETAAFLLPFSRIGLMTDGGSSASVAASIGRARAMRLALLGDPVPAREALEMGLITHVAAAEEFAATVEKLAARLIAGPAIAQTAIKRAINAATLPDFEAVLDREHSGQRALFRTADFIEGITAFGERRAPVFRGE